MTSLGDKKKYEEKKDLSDKEKVYSWSETEDHEKKKNIKKHKKDDHDKKTDCGCGKKENHSCACHGCICRLLRKAGTGTMIRLVTDSGDIIEGKFLGFTSEDCCITVEVNEIISPPIPCEIVFVDCEKIESLVFTSPS